MKDDAPSFPCPLRAAALAAPKTAALVGARGITSYEELDRMVSAAAFRLGGLEPGSRVALYLPKDGRYVALMLALIRAGHVACPISDRLPPRGVARLLESAACSALISEDEELLQAVGLIKPEPAALFEGGPPEFLGVRGRRIFRRSVPLPSSSLRGAPVPRRRRSTRSATTTTARSARTPTSRSGPAIGGSILCRCITSGGFP